MLVTDLKKSHEVKDGVCPRQSYVNFDRSMCRTSRCEDDADCAGKAKCCKNEFCKAMTCTGPLGMYVFSI